MKSDNEIISYFKRAANTVRLSFAEREQIKNHIIYSPYLFHSTFWTYRRLVGVIAILTLVITTGGTSFAAASSLPGDTLYSVKVNVNEEVQSIIAITPDAKVKVAADRVKERLNEADALSAKGDLTPTKQAIIKQNLKRHTDALKVNVAVLASANESDKVEEATEVIDDLKTSLDQHEASLEVQSSTAVDATSSAKVSDDQNVATTSPSSNEKLSAILSGVIETKAEVENLQKTLDEKDGDDEDDNKNGTTTIDIDINASSTATTSISIDIDASSTATTTDGTPDGVNEKHPLLHFRYRSI